MIKFSVFFYSKIGEKKNTMENQCTFKLKRYKKIKYKLMLEN